MLHYRDTLDMQSEQFTGEMASQLHLVVHVLLSADFQAAHSRFHGEPHQNPFSIHRRAPSKFTHEILNT